MDMRLFAYWRVQDDPVKHTHNLAAGGRLDMDSDPGLQRKGIKLVRSLLSLAGIDLAGIDLIFSRNNVPLLLEINYTFRQKGAGRQRGLLSAPAVRCARLDAQAGAPLRQKTLS